jgi:hypothetical protein
MNRKDLKILPLVLLVLAAGCSKIQVPIQQALSNITLCEEKVEYRFSLGAVSNPLANFSASTVGGTVTKISGDCGPGSTTSSSILLSEHSIVRAASDLTIKVGTESILSLKISSNSLSGQVPDSCREGNRAIHSIESGVISSSPKEIKLTIASKIVASSCP